ncbi:MAG: TonB-dependent receptor [Bacteroidia bacterium]|nr:TonB-dependent receptor [Bacteroidia bacterium]
MKRRCLLVFGLLFGYAATAQQVNDSSKIKSMNEAMITAWQNEDITRLSAEHNGFLLAGKKNEVVQLAHTNANVALKNGRQLFAKAPGVFVYDMDGSGNQLNIATRGLDPHRSWEFNIRQNGIIINSDMYGYPASHYSAPMESYEKIELIRGTAALQYGAQFGGMLNYCTKKPDSTKLFSFENNSTIGSYNLKSTYNAISGTYKKFSYYAYYYFRYSNGYRRNSNSTANAQFLQLNYQFTPKISLHAAVGRSIYLYQSPGPLNDSMFHRDPTMSVRDRNYFSPEIYVPSITLNWDLKKHTKMVFTTSGVFGNRSSVQFDAFATVHDSGNNRQVDIDKFNSKTIEFRLLQEYKLGSIQNKLATGIVYMNNDLHRQQLGVGNHSNEYDLSLTTPGFGRDMHFKTQNIAWFIENAFHISKKFTISAGARFESGNSKMDGVIKYYTVHPLPNMIAHQFGLLGLSSQYILNETNTLYCGISQSYRPVLFKDIVPASTFEQIDNNLKDAFGYNLELGMRGTYKNRLKYDVSCFRLQYNNRMGTLVLQDSLAQYYTFKTNIGNSLTQGIELFLQYKFPILPQWHAGIFTSTSFMDAHYTAGQVAVGTENKSMVGNKVESVPQWISRNGIEMLYKKFSFTLMHSYTSASYSDALNTETPSKNGAKGLVPAYSLWDANAQFQTKSSFSVRFGISNIFNKQYFTKRPAFYPGPGIWSSDGRNVYLTIGFKL